MEIGDVARDGWIWDGFNRMHSEILQWMDFTSVPGLLTL